MLHRTYLGIVWTVLGNLLGYVGQLLRRFQEENTSVCSLLGGPYGFLTCSLFVFHAFLSLTSPKGHHRLPPAFSWLAIYGEAFGFSRFRRFRRSKVSQASLGGSWGRLQAFCGVLGWSWGSVRASGGVLGPLERILGTSLDLLGSSEADLGATKTLQKWHAKQNQLQDPSTQFPPPLWGRFLAPQIDQNGIRSESNFKTMFKSEKLNLQEPLGGLGPILMHFGGYLGVPESVPV